jgi:transcriptional regulator with XRE-family HTH domain
MTDTTALAVEAAASYPSIGTLLKERRAYHGWTLADVSRMTGVSKSALSKVENGLMSPTYQTILQICHGLQIEIADLFPRTDAEGTGPARPISGRRSVARQHEGIELSNEAFTYRYLCSDVAHRRIIPMVVEVRARERAQLPELWSHVGEEFIYVLEGALTLCTEGYEDIELAAGDCVYIDSTMAHGYLAAGDGPAKLLVACSSATPNLAQTLRAVLKERFARDLAATSNALSREGRTRAG